LPGADIASIRVVDSVQGGGGTDFGVPSAITALDRRRTTAGDAARLAGLVEAAWTVLGRVAATATGCCRTWSKPMRRMPVRSACG